jgi:hypothetical protein
MAMDLVDTALVDIAISTESYVGARAIWDINTVSEVFLAIAKPDSIGLSSIGGLTNPISATDSHGLHIEIDKPVGSKYVSAPLTAGNIAKVGIKNISNMVPNHPYVVKKTPCTIALDGERSIPLRYGDSVTIVLTRDGPPVIDPHKTLKIVGQNKLYFVD